MSIKTILDKHRATEHIKAVWVTVNLPWLVSDTPEHREVDRLSDEFAAWFDAESATRFGSQVDVDIDYESLTSLLDAYPDLDDRSNWESEAGFHAFLAAHAGADPLVGRIAARRYLKAQQGRWESSSPECKAWLDRIEVAAARRAELSFCNHEACAPGVLLEVRSFAFNTVRRVMLGHCNSSGMHGYEGSDIEDDDVVVRYLDLRQSLGIRP